jgi:AcrR family transcriptional regulator
VEKSAQKIVKEAKPTLRTAPQQLRGQERVNLILDVSEELLLTKGYEALTTNAVAAEAGISIGSLYHFFADKVAILEALIARYNEAYLEILTKAHQDKNIKLETYLDTFLGTLVHFSEGRPGLIIAFSHAITASDKFEAMESEFTARVTAMMGAYYQQRRPKLSKKKATLVAWTIMAMAEGFLLAVGNAKDGEARYLEIKKAMRGYLESYLS